MKLVESPSDTLRIEFAKKDLNKIVEPIIKNAEQFSAVPLDMVYLLGEQDYRIDDHFQQPKGVFD
ncbi:hypothetical protein HFU84_10635 [Acidithiobacillus sp. CV18-2]|uniref:Uncharacterized protein n=1 Tax=Igneacidithiobacillus copahuensis TaxID=2724909 RepID=A0AAE2YPJ4_9PROT|nr:hypothetical protein [Igneacidithiobacillus copahuensis]MBU2755546.1 hypothetical protein [Acidithiobacillus sp. CV18-3]MBU2757783.1 hypothetical protein [Acidithiobacillus sp. BN09-2]MBU2777952.1 hypothetical protein [Acidithiobacillus sp. CV18-2]MBU2797878.1 hypothetical protein [Acidithiobacillus sp. VAN18-2]MBU2799276.1 hypothetical protein [Acidithiobacillus sp. VAN18-4]UTV80665.1 hypothetical protein MQE22_11705 [Acidithiobacillus sp. YTS05]